MQAGPGPGTQKRGTGDQEVGEIWIGHTRLADSSLSSLSFRREKKEGEARQLTG
jgi:hypothetical protein